MVKNIKNVGQTMEHLYLNRNQTGEQMGDVIFLVESQRIRAHRFVLAVQSPKYKAQFNGMHPDEDEIDVPFVSAAAFNVFLQFFYKETIDLTMENIAMVLDLAKQSLVDEFVESCVNFLKDAITVNSNLCDAYRLANLYDIESLRLDCERRISENTMDVFASDSFLRCDRNVLCQILKMDTLNCNESYVFHASIAWARAQCEQNDLDDENPKNLRAALGDVIHEIRFTSFSADEFAVLHKLMNGFFTADESIELFYIVNKVKDFKSKKFNLNPRTSSEKPKPTNAWTLEFNRFVRINKLPEPIDVIGLSNFSFTCSNPIRLHGFTLGMHFKTIDPNQFSMRLSVGARQTKRHGDDHSVSFKSKYKVCQGPVKSNETMILFEQPIERVVKFTCFISIPFKRLNYRFDLHSSGRVNNIFFKFYDGERITRLFFDTYST